MVRFIKTMKIIMTIILVIGLQHSATKAEVLIPATNKILSDKFFGLHVHRLKTKETQSDSQYSLPDLKIGVLRTWDAYLRWADLEPRKGEWKLEKLDGYIDFAKSKGADVIITLGSTPKWASERPAEACAYHPEGCAAPPQSMIDWENYIYIIATRYKGVVCCYEVWNEPDFSGPPADSRKRAGFYTGSVEQLVEMTRIAAKVLAKVDPNAIVLSPGFVNGVSNRLVPYLEAGGHKYINGIAYHFYAWYDDRRMIREIQAVKKVQKSYGLEMMPIWSTEAGVEVISEDEVLPPGYIRINRKEAAAHVVRQVTIAAFSGLDKYIYYSWDHKQAGLVSSGGEKYPSYFSIKRLLNALVGSQLEGCMLENSTAVFCEAKNNNNRFLVAWSFKMNKYCAVTEKYKNISEVHSIIDDKIYFYPKNGAAEVCIDNFPKLIYLNHDK